MTIATATRPRTIAKVTGLAAPYNVWATVRHKGYTYREILRPSAFWFAMERARQRGQYVLCCANHHYQIPFGSTRNGDLKLSENPKYGLLFELDLADTKESRWLLHKFHAGEFLQMSFLGFGPDTRQQIQLAVDTGRELDEVEVYDAGTLQDISFVDRATYGNTQVYWQEY